MEKQQLLAKTQEALSPFETENIIALIKGMTFTVLIESPLFMALLLVVLFFAFIKRSRFVLLFLFTLVALLALVQYSLPETTDMTITSLLPFAFGCLGIGTVLIYFTFIKVE